MATVAASQLQDVPDPGLCGAGVGAVDACATYETTGTCGCSCTACCWWHIVHNVHRGHAVLTTSTQVQVVGVPGHAGDRTHLMRDEGGLGTNGTNLCF